MGEGGRKNKQRTFATIVKNRTGVRESSSEKAISNSCREIFRRTGKGQGRIRNGGTPITIRGSGIRSRGRGLQKKKKERKKKKA